MASDTGGAGVGVMIDDISITSTGPVPTISGVKCVGVGGNYPTLTAAVADLNSKVLNGPLTFLLIDPSYGATETQQGLETFPIVMNRNSGSSMVNTVVIKPGGNPSNGSSAKSPPGPTPAPCTNPGVVSITGSSATALIVFNGAIYTTIDGSKVPAGTDQSLTIENTNPGASSAVVWLQTTPGLLAATNNTVKNVNLVGNSNTTTLFGVGSGSSSISTSSLGTDNDNNTFQNCNISKTQYGIYSQGASAANKNTGTIIRRNLITTLSPNNVQIGGIMVGFENNIEITENVVSGMNRANSAFGIGVGFVTSSFSPSVFTGNEVTNAIISRNNIGAITSTGNSSSIGIALASAASGTSQIANNAISGVTSNSTPNNFSAGIFVGGGAGSTTQMYFNSVSMTGARGAAATASYALAVGGNNPFIDIRDNILFNTQTSMSGGKSYAIGLAYSTYSNLTSDYNDLFAAGPQGVLGVVGSLVQGSGMDLPTLAAWQGTTGKDANSISANPLFLSLTNLHITCTSPAADKGTPIAAVTNDFDGDPRSLTAPDIGADEIAPPIPLSAVSRKMHGGAGAFDINLPLSGPVGIECRSGGVTNDYQVVVTFASPVTVGTAALSAGTGSVANASGSGTNTITVNLTGVTNAQTITLGLNCVDDGLGKSGNLAVSMGVLLADTNSDRSVNAGDAIQTRNRSGQTIDGSNFRSDVNVDGSFNSGDTIFVRARSGTFLP